jgi:hypothetical protein
MQQSQIGGNELSSSATVADASAAGPASQQIITGAISSSM